MYDLIIEDGKLVDGTGAPARVADVAVKDGVIVAVGPKLGGRARQRIDAEGRLVTPGFVDMHTHYDAQVTWDPYLTPSSWHGCTSVVMGSCGVGFAPAAPDKHDWLIGLMEGVEDIPGAALHEGIQWGWESFAEYLDAVERMPRAIDVAAQVPHGPLRAYVMGDRGAANEEATTDDIRQMAAIVRDALQAGAVGFSTSRTILHKSVDGEPVPGTFASAAELFGIGRVLGELGTGVFQTATDHLNVPGEFEWFARLAREIQRPVVFNLSQTDQAPHLWKRLLGMLERAHADGIPVYGQVAGRAIGVMMGWRATAHPFVAYPSYVALSQLPWEERRAALRDPTVRARILADAPVDLYPFADFLTRSFEKMFVLGEHIDYEPTADQSVAAIARRTGRTPQEVAYDALCADDAEAMLYFPLFNYADTDLQLLHTLHSHPLTFMGLSDAGAHCGAVCDGGMPTFMLTHWTRDRTRGPKLALEHVVRRQTQETARLYGMYDRGVVAPGYLADLNVIDYDALRFHDPRIVYDLPAGGRRLVQRADGYIATVKHGCVIMQDGAPTGALPGKLVRGTQQAPAIRAA